MTDTEFERYVCTKLSEQDMWVLNIPKNRAGQQPFDVIALSRGKVIALDCKVCGTGRFPMSRIEPNQWTAFETIKRKTGTKNIGIVCYRNDVDKLYYVDYETLSGSRFSASIKLEERYVIDNDCKYWEGHTNKRVWV